MELFAESYDTRALHEGNQWLLQCLQASEKSCKQYRSVIKQQQRRISALEADGERALDHLERQWKARLQQKEKEWMQEYAAQTQSLLQIIQHQERVQVRLEDELDRLRSCRTTKPLTAPSSAGADDLKCRCHHVRTAIQPASCSPDTIDLLTNSPETSAPEAIEAGLL